MQLLSSGEHPPAEAEHLPSVGEIEMLSRLVDALPADALRRGLEHAALGLSPAQVDPCVPAPDADVPLRERVEIMLQDLQGVSDWGQPFRRYLVLEGNCERERQRLLRATNRAVNNVSTAPEIVALTELGSGVLALDIRNYQWDRPLDLEKDAVIDFDDGWQAMVSAAHDYAVPYEGGAADLLTSLAQTAVPWLRADVFVQHSQTGDLYYALTKASQHRSETESSLGVSWEQSSEAGELLRAGYVSQSIHETPVHVARRPQARNQDLPFWSQSEEAFTGNEGFNGVDAALKFDPFSGRTMRSLPNGLWAYGVADDEGNRTVEVPGSIVGFPDLHELLATEVNSYSCGDCHAEGLFPLGDTVRSSAEQALDSFGPGASYDATLFERLRKQYPGDEAVESAIKADNEIYFQALLELEPNTRTRIGVDPIFGVVAASIYGDITGEVAASELGVSAEEFRRKLEFLDPALARLGVSGGAVERQLFRLVYRDSLCILHEMGHPNEPMHPVGCR